MPERDEKMLDERTGYAPLILFEYDHDPGKYRRFVLENPRPKRAPSRQLFDERLPATGSHVASLEVLDDLATDLPVREHHLRVHRPHDPRVGLLEEHYGLIIVAEATGKRWVARNALSRRDRQQVHSRIGDDPKVSFHRMHAQ